MRDSFTLLHLSLQPEVTDVESDSHEFHIVVLWILLNECDLTIKLMKQLDTLHGQNDLLRFRVRDAFPKSTVSLSAS